MNANTSVSNANISVKFFQLDHIKKQIVGSEYHFKLSGNPANDEYVELMFLMESHPNYELVSVASKKKVAHKKTYAGLDKPTMTDYINFFGSDEQKEKFAQMVRDKVVYPTMKSWFLEQFKGFVVAKALREIQKQKLENNKKPYIVVVQAKSNAKTLPAAANQ